MKKIIYIVLVLVTILLTYSSYYLYQNNYSTYKNYEYKNNVNAAIYYKLNFISNYSFKMFEDKHMVWKKSLIRNVDVNYIVSILDYTKNDLNNEYCKKINKKTDVDNAILCLDTYYTKRGYHNLIRVEIDEIYALMPEATNSIVKQKTQSILYLLDDLTRLKMASSKNIDKIYENYKEIKNEIENELADMKKKI